MNIALLGNFSVPYCSEVGYKRELESLGHTVWALQETMVTGEQVLRMASTSDLFVWIHSHGFETPGLPMDIVLKQLRTLNIPSVAYHLDLYMPLSERWQEYKDSAYMNGIEYFFTVDKLMADWLNENTNTKGRFLAAGIPSFQVYKAKSDLQYKSDICFVGSKNYHELWEYRPTLINWLSRTYGDRFVHWGRDGVGLVRDDKMNVAYASTKIAVADTLCMGFDYPYYLSDRVFNQTGAGAFTIHPYIKGIENYFDIGKEIVTYEFGNFEQLKGLIDFYLNNDKPREMIRERGFKRTKKDHTYKQRWQTILNEMGLS